MPLLEAWLYLHTGSPSIDLGKTIWALLGSCFAVSLARHLRAILHPDWMAPLTSAAILASTATLLDGFWTRRLRYLSLDGRHIGDAGAKALAACPALAGLTRLSLRNCGIGEVGAAALFASPHLQGLVELNLGRNGVYGAVAALADPAINAKLAALGGAPLASTPAEFGAFIAADTEKWAKVIKSANIKAD